MGHWLKSISISRFVIQHILTGVIERPEANCTSPHNLFSKDKFQAKATHLTL